MPLSSVYSGVVSLRVTMMIIFLAKLNALDSRGTEIGNAYLEEFSKEQVHILAGPEFGPLQGHYLIINNSL